METGRLDPSTHPHLSTTPSELGQLQEVRKGRDCVRKTFQRSMAGCSKILSGGFPGGAVVESLPANAGDTGSSPGPGRSHVPRSN